MRSQASTLDLARAAFLEFRRTRDPQPLARVFDLVAQELLLVAHHLARRGVSAEDLVQTTFLDALRSADSYDASRPLMPWLCGILVNVARRQNREQSREYDAWRFDAALVEDPAELAAAREFAQALRSALAEFPSPQRDVLTLRLVHGLTPTQIAHALGHPVGSVKSWIHRGVERLRLVLPTAFGAALANYSHAAPSLEVQRAQLLERATELCRPIPAEERVDSGGARLETAVRSSVARRVAPWLALGFVAVLGWVALRPSSSGPPAPPTSSALARGASDDPRSTAESFERAARSSAPSSPSVPRRGCSLEIRARFASDDAPAPILVRLEPRFGPDPEFRARVVRTDAEGLARLDDLDAGEWEVRPDRAAAQFVRIASEPAQIELSIPAGVAARGRVRDEAGTALAGANVWLSRSGSMSEGEVVGTTDAAGAFWLRDLPKDRALAVVADGLAPSSLQFVAAVGDEAVEFRLSRTRRELRGRVCDESGAPLRGARVLVGALIEPSWIAASVDGHELNAPLTLVTDEAGSFSGAWLPAPWSAPVRVRAAGYVGSTHVGPVDGPLRVELTRGNPWRGTLESESFPLGPVRLSAQSLSEEVGAPSWLQPSFFAAPTASFEVAGLGPGPRRLVASDGRGRTCSVVMRPRADEALLWSPTCGAPAVMRGSVRDWSGAPLVGAQVTALQASGGKQVMTSDRGEFELSDLGEGGATVITRAAPNGLVLDRRSWRPDAVSPLEIVIEIERLPTAFVVLRALDSENRALTGAELSFEGEPILAPVEQLADGRLRVGPLPAGVHHLLVYGDGGEGLHLGPVRLERGAEVDCGELRAAPPGRLDVRIAGLSDGDRQSAAASLTSADGRASLTFFKLLDGRGTTLNTEPGERRLRVVLPQSGVVDVPARVTSGESVVLELSAPRGAAVTFVLQDEAFDSALRLRTVIENLDDGALVRFNSALRRSPEDGSRRITWNLPPARYRVSFSDGFALNGASEFAVTGAARRVEVPVELR